MSNPTKKILMIAAEDSSCLYAERLIEYWQSKELDYKIFGVGSQKMESMGFERLGKSEELAVMGAQEVIKHWSVIKKTFLDIVSRCEKERPDVAIFLDYPGFNLKMAKKLNQLGIKTVYYISPKVWAWKKSRIKLFKKYIDKMIVIFPFEKGFYKKHDYEVEYVGHPLLDEMSPKFSDPEYINQSRSRYGIKEGDRVVALMPGSRKSEIERHLNVQLKVAERLYKKDKTLRFALFVAPGLTKDYLQAQVPYIKFPLMLIKDEPFEMISLADAVLAASGTANLFVGLLKKPMVVMYIMKPVTAFLAKTFVRSIKFFGIVNLIFDKEVSVELFQEKANVDRLTLEMEKIIFDEENKQGQINELSKLKNMLGHSGVTEKVANCIEGML